MAFSRPRGLHWARAVEAIRRGDGDTDQEADRLLAAMRTSEVLGLLDGDAPRRALPLIPLLLHRRVFVAGAVPRLGVPGVRFTDGARGVVVGRATAFPVTMARAATWDPALEQRIGAAMGLEARAVGANYAASVCVNLLRHPAWGRAQECYGEDPVLTSRMGASLTRGLEQHVMACVKHFALNSMDDARFGLDVRVEPHALHEVYLPHFRAAVEAGASSLMTAYNRVNGEWMDEHRTLLTDVLRDEWGFTGFVTSDWVFGTHDAVRSLVAGTEVEMPLRLLRARALPAALARGDLPRTTVHTAARRILSTGLAHAARVAAAPPDRAVIACAEHRALAREAAARSTVLLRNEPVGGAPMLPLDPGRLRRVAVIGRLAARANLGDHGSSRVRPPQAVTPLDGLRRALPASDVRFDRGRDPCRAAALAGRADVAVVVVGLDEHDEGESVVTGGVDVGVLGRAFRRGPLRACLTGTARLAALFVRGGDRTRLTLAPVDERLVLAVAQANPSTVVVLVGGSAILAERWRRRVPAIIVAWYGGMAGGDALADVLTGAAEPEGRLPFAIPTDAAHLPPFDRHATTARYDDRWGQRLLDAEGHPAAFPFGFGLGYTRFEVALETHRLSEDGGSAVVVVRNTGARAGSSVAQVYAADRSAPRPVARLLGFARVRLAAGTETRVTVRLDATPLLERDPATRRWSRRPGDWMVAAAECSRADWDTAADAW